MFGGQRSNNYLENKMASNTPDSKDGYVDITNLIQRCVTESLSYSHPFTPLVPPCSLPMSAGSGKSAEAEGGSGGGDAGLMIQGSSLPITSADDHADDGGPNVKGDQNSLSLTPIDMREAMTALELGDERMDCCEIPIINSEKLDGHDGGPSSSPSQSSQRTIPPRIAPLHLSDGTMSMFQSSSSAKPDVIPTQPSSNDNSSSTNVPLKLQSSPCPSLLPYWETLSISSSSSSHQILPLLLLQLTSLEAYIGTNNGGSNAAETLYCMLWCHDGVLADMRDKLTTNTQASPLDEVTVAQWILFASSIGVVRIAEAVRWAVVNADIYEEEDFGVALHGGADDTDNDGGDNDEQSPSQQLPSSSTSTMRFCPLLKQERAKDSATMSSIPTYHADEYIDEVWDTALKHLREYAKSRKDTDGNEYDSVHALEIILRLQQSFYRSICRLSELNDQNVTDFTEQAKNRSRETVTLLNELSTCKAVTSSVTASQRLVETDGRLRSVGDERIDSLLHASFDPFVNRRLLGNAPVRKARFCNTFKVIDSLSRVVSEIEWAVCDVILEGNTLGRIMCMIENNSSRGIGGASPTTTKPNNDDNNEPPFGNSGLAIENPVGINVLSRSLMLLNLYFDDKLLGQYDFPDMIGEYDASLVISEVFCFVYPSKIIGVARTFYL